ncbi:MAG TPA: beta-galactosidase GalA [Candidatus Acidoferrales bacterium]|nr:beta-galactosidase GalA [Candidatus Acidoferrales bacterium]
MTPKNFTRRDVLKIGAIAPAAARAFASQSASPLLSEAESPRQEIAGHPELSPRERLLLDFNWRFHFGHADDPARDFGYGKGGAFAKSGELLLPSRHNFDDSQWQTIDLPHDFAVALPFINAPELTDYGYKPVGRNFPETSIGWYRRVFEIPADDSNRRLSLEFDGVFRDAIVVLNGIYLGRNLSGYAPFRFDITDFVRYGEKNILVVRVDATEHEGWFYEGAGIYRHVWLLKTSPLHVAQDGVYVTSKQNGSSAQISIATEVANESDSAQSFRVTQAIFDSAGKQIATVESDVVSIPQWAAQTISQTLRVENPSLWSLANPTLYRLVTTTSGGSQILDHCETPFGIRDFHFDPDKGLFLNGEHVEIKGTCNHQDHAGVGSALPDRLQYFRVARLKEMGANAYRTSHNPPTPALLDACDRLGMFVMDETRMMSSSREGLSQLERMVRRDRNHPSIFLWSLGNEEPLQGTSTGARICASMKRLVRRLDSSRPVTLAMNGRWGQGASAVLDVQGFNYFHEGSVDKFHADFPAQPCFGSEEASALCTRGIYSNDPVRGYMSAYDVNTPGHYASTAEQWWNFYSARPFAAGAFLWTGFDYRGEPSPYQWPCISSHFGVIDTCGFPKDTFFYYQAWWTSQSVLHVFPHWNWPGKEGQPISVWAHGNCEEVELLLNGKSLGKHPMPRNSHLEWKVNYVPGTLLARGFTGGRLASESKQETTGAPATVKLTPDRQTIDADGEDVAVIAVEILDDKNRVVPIAANEVTFELTGPGKIIGVGNGDPSSHEADKPPAQLYDSHGALMFGSMFDQSARPMPNTPQILVMRRCFNGLAQVIVQSQKQPGDIVLTARSSGLQSATLKIAAGAAPSRPAVP